MSSTEITLKTIDTKDLVDELVNRFPLGIVIGAISSTDLEIYMADGMQAVKVGLVKELEKYVEYNSDSFFFGFDEDDEEDDDEEDDYDDML
jgi:hypothetical protein